MKHQSLMYTPFCPQGVRWCGESGEGVCVNSIWHDLSSLLIWFSDFCRCDSTSHLASPLFLSSTSIYAYLVVSFLCSCLVLLLQPFSSLPLFHHKLHQTHILQGSLSSFAVSVWCSSSELYISLCNIWFMPALPSSSSTKLSPNTERLQLYLFIFRV